MKVHGTIKLVALCAVFMLAVPFGLRFFLDRFGPEDSVDDRTASEKLQEMFGDGHLPPAQAEDLLRKPLSEWTAWERSTEPELHAWLEARSSVVLPWEWSDAARTKDEAGYRQSWRSVYGEFASVCKKEGSLSASEMKRLRAELTARTELLVDVTNALSLMKCALSTNGVPTKAEFLRLKKGWLWGYNRKTEKRELKTVDELRQAIAAETAYSCTQQEMIAVLKRDVKNLESRKNDFEELLRGLENPQTEGSGDFTLIVKAIRCCTPKHR